MDTANTAMKNIDLKQDLYIRKNSKKNNFASWYALEKVSKEPTLSVSIHPYDIYPNCKIIRLNGHMLVSPYLDGITNSSFYNNISQKDHPYIFVDQCK